MCRLHALYHCYLWNVVLLLWAPSVLWDMGIPLTLNLKFVPGRAPCVPELKEEMGVCSRSVFGVEPSQMSFLFFLMYAAAAGGVMPLLENTSGGAQEIKVKVLWLSVWGCGFCFGGIPSSSLWPVSAQMLPFQKTASFLSGQVKFNHHVLFVLLAFFFFESSLSFWWKVESQHINNLQGVSFYFLSSFPEAIIQSNMYRWETIHQL